MIFMAVTHTHCTAVKLLCTLQFRSKPVAVRSFALNTLIRYFLFFFFFDDPQSCWTNSSPKNQKYQYFNSQKPLAFYLFMKTKICNWINNNEKKKNYKYYRVIYKLLFVQGLDTLLEPSQSFYFVLRFIRRCFIFGTNDFSNKL